MLLVQSVVELKFLFLFHEKMAKICIYNIYNCKYYLVLYYF